MEQASHQASEKCAHLWKMVGNTPMIEVITRTKVNPEKFTPNANIIT